MKKLFILLCSVILSIPIFAQDLVYTVAAANGTNSTYAGSCVITVNNVNWTVQGNTNMSGTYAITGWGIGGKSLSKAQRTISCKSLPYKFDSISVTHKVNNGITVDSFYVILDSDTIFATQEQITLMQDSNAVVKFKVNQVYSNPSVSFVYVITNNLSKNKRIEFSKAEFYNTNKIDTAIQNAEETVKIIKTIENNQVVIIRDGIRYTVTGTKIR